MKYRYHKPKRSRWSIFPILIILIIFVLGIILGYLIYPYVLEGWNKLSNLLEQSEASPSAQQESSPSSQPQMISFEKYYLPVVNLQSQRSDIPFEEIKSLLKGEDSGFTLYLAQESVEDLKTIFKLDQLAGSILSDQELIDQIKSDQNAFSILAFENLDLQVKALSINQNSPLNQDFSSENYPLKVSQEIQKGTDHFDYSKDKLLTIVGTGEIILSRGVAERIMKYNDNLYPFLKIKDALASADLRVGTLEAPLVSNCVYSRDTMVFCGEPEYLEGVLHAKISVLSMAANHIKDYGESGIQETINLLNQNKIGHFGAGMNFNEAHQPLIKEVKGVKIGFLGYNDVVPTAYEATETTAGSAWANIDEIKTDVENLRNQVDLVIILIHWGVEYTHNPNQRQKDIAYAAVEAGADLIIGDHPHWVQGIEFYQDKLIVYSVGNFVFDQMWSQKTKEGVLLELTFYDKNLAQFAFEPFIIEDYAQPRLANQEEGQVILDNIWEASSF